MEEVVECLVMAQRSEEVMSRDQHTELMSYAVGYFKEARSQVVAELDWTLGLILGLVVTGSMGAGVGDKKPPMTYSDFDGKPVLSSGLEYIEKDVDQAATRFWGVFAGLMGRKIEVSRYFSYTFDTEVDFYYHFSYIRDRHDALSIICDSHEVAQGLIRVGQRERFNVFTYYSG